MYLVGNVGHIVHLVKSFDTFFQEFWYFWSGGLILHLCSSIYFTSSIFIYILYFIYVHLYTEVYTWRTPACIWFWMAATIVHLAGVFNQLGALCGNKGDPFAPALHSSGSRHVFAMQREFKVLYLAYLAPYVMQYIDFISCISILYMQYNISCDVLILYLAYRYAV